MGLLDGQIADAIYAGFKGLLLTGRLERTVPSTTLDKRGMPTGSTETTWPCEGFEDNFTDYQRATAGIPITDAKVCIFAKSLPAGVRPEKDDKVTLFRAGVPTTWQLRERIQVDPAGALWECQAYVL